MLLPVFITVLLLPLIEIVIFILASNFLSFIDIVSIILVSGIIGFYNLSRAKVGASRAIELILKPQINNKNQHCIHLQNDYFGYFQMSFEARYGVLKR